MDYLIHYGVKGMKWGHRKSRRKSDESVNSIVRSMSEEDKRKMNLYEDYDHSDLIKRILKKVGDTPASFLDIQNVDGSMNVTVGTRSGQKYRGKGYANDLVKKGTAWWDKNKSKYGNKKLSWWVLENNKGSIRLAEKNNFKRILKDSERYPGWRHYEY